MRTPEEIRKWARTLQHLLQTTRNTDLLHGKSNRLVLGEGGQKEFHGRFEQMTCLRAGIVIRLGVFFC